MADWSAVRSTSYRPERRRRTNSRTTPGWSTGVPVAVRSMVRTSSLRAAVGSSNQPHELWVRFRIAGSKLPGQHPRLQRAALLDAEVDEAAPKGSGHWGVDPASGVVRSDEIARLEELRHPCLSQPVGLVLMPCAFEPEDRGSEAVTRPCDCNRAHPIAGAPPQAHNFGVVRGSRLRELGGQPDLAVPFEKAACLTRAVQEVGEDERGIQDSSFPLELRDG